VRRRATTLLHIWHDSIWIAERAAAWATVGAEGQAGEDRRCSTGRVGRVLSLSWQRYTFSLSGVACGPGAPHRTRHLSKVLLGYYR
jgi:hypothetical protein